MHQYRHLTHGRALIPHFTWIYVASYYIRIYMYNCAGERQTIVPCCAMQWCRNGSIRIHTYTCTRIYTDSHTHKYTHEHTHKHIYAKTYIYTHKQGIVHKHVYADAYSHTHTQGVKAPVLYQGTGLAAVTGNELVLPILRASSTAYTYQLNEV
jgi:hypothetical protein